MRDGNAIANAGGAQPFALQDDVEYLALGKSGDFRGLGRQFLQQLFLGVCLERRQNGVLRNQISKRHDEFLVLGPRSGPHCSLHVKGCRPLPVLAARGLQPYFISANAVRT